MGRISGSGGLRGMAWRGGMRLVRAMGIWLRAGAKGLVLTDDKQEPGVAVATAEYLLLYSIAIVLLIEGELLTQ